MVEYRLVLTATAAKELSKLSNPLLTRIASRMDSLTSNPRPTGCRKLAGGDKEWRIRVGDYRIVYTIDDSLSLVEVTRIRHRSEVYKR